MHREPRILSRYFPGLFRRGGPAASPPEPPLTDESQPLASVAPRPETRRGQEGTGASGTLAPVLAVTIDLPPSSEEEDEAPPAAASERLVSLETAQEGEEAESSAPSGADDADDTAPPPLVEATHSREESAGANPLVTDPDRDPVLAGRPRMRRLPMVPPAALPAELPAATFPRTYYETGAPPAAPRVSSPGQDDRPRRIRWPLRFLSRRTSGVPAGHFP